MSAETKKLYFFKTPPAFGYFAGKTYNVPTDQAERFLANGTARLATEVLPVDVPARKKLIEAGYMTEEDLLKDSGIAKKASLTQDEAKALASYLSGDQEAPAEVETTTAIPEDIPGYDHLIDAGLKTIEDIESYNDLTKIKGIGDATKEDIVNYLAENK